MISHDKDVVSGWYYIGQGRLHKRPCVALKWVPREEAINDEAYVEKKMGEHKLLEVSQGSLGCCLIKKEVLENIVFVAGSGLGENMRRCHDDTFFFADCDIFGFKVYVDTDMICGHFQSDWWKSEFERIEEMKNKKQTLEVLKNG